MPRSDDHPDRRGAAADESVAFAALQATLYDRSLPQRTLFGCIAHDLSGPLTYVHWDVDALARLIEMFRQAVDRSPDGNGFEGLCEAHPKLGRAYHEVPTLMEHIKGGLQRLQRLSADLALLAEDDRTPQTFDLRDAVTTTLRLIRPFVTRRLQIVYEPDDSPQLVRGVCADLVQALMNLGFNAAEACTEGPAEGRLRIQFERSPQHVILRLVDNGAGLAGDDTEGLFRPFVSHREGHSGLGLAVVEQVIGDHGGTVSLKPAHPIGVEITIRLPRQGT